MMRVIFMGSPAEVVTPLQGLYEQGAAHGLTLVGIVSQPARPAGRGGKLADPPVAIFGRERSIPTLQPESAKDASFLESVRRLQPDVIITAAYGQILTDEFLKIPKIATINIHPSLLPSYRGATPIPAALMDGLKTTGVTILFTVKQLDAGNIISQKTFEIGPNETTLGLTQRLFSESSPMLLDVLSLLSKDPSFKGSPQDTAAATFCRKISKEMGRIDWSMDAATIFNRYRAFYPWPGSFTNLGSKVVAITEMSCGDINESKGKPGTFEYDKSIKSMTVNCGKGSVRINKLKPAGGKEMDAASFWNGLKDRSAPQFQG
jgi:methionyl-tRNA formyltransferase